MISISQVNLELTCAENYSFYKEDYMKFMKDLFDKGYAETVPGVVLWGCTVNNGIFRLQPIETETNKSSL